MCFQCNIGREVTSAPQTEISNMHVEATVLEMDVEETSNPDHVSVPPAVSSQQPILSRNSSLDVPTAHPVLVRISSNASAASCKSDLLSEGWGEDEDEAGWSGGDDDGGWGEEDDEMKGGWHEETNDRNNSFPTGMDIESTRIPSLDRMVSKERKTFMRHSSIPSFDDETSLVRPDTLQAVEEDLLELIQIPRFQQAAVDYMGGSGIRVRLSLSVDHLMIGHEQALAWNIDPDEPIYVVVDFGPYYTMGDAAPRVVCIGQAESLNKPVRPFQLSWFLADRLKKGYFKGQGKCLSSRPYRVADVVNMSEATGARYGVCVAALKNARGSQNDASLVLFEKTLRDKLEEEVESESTARIFHFLDSDIAKNWEVSSAAEIFGASPSASYNGAFGFACDLLATEVTQFQDNYLIRLLLFVESKIKSCNKNCLICDVPLPIAGLKPKVCDSEVCSMAFEELGLGFDLRMEVLHNPEIVDLSICLVISAIKQNRLLFVTPTGIIAKDPLTGEELTFGETEEKLDHQHILRVLEQCPSLEDMRSHLDSVRESVRLRTQDKYPLKSYLDTYSPLLYPLLRWILTSNRSHIRPLKPFEMIKGANTKHQFAMLSNAPAKEARFQTLKREAAAAATDESLDAFTKGYGPFPPTSSSSSSTSSSTFPSSATTSITTKKGTGGYGVLSSSPSVKSPFSNNTTGSVFAFHGSNTGNWHSILRTGLKNLSNTKYMVCGAAKGAGIYMATQAVTSLGYCRQAGGWANSMFGPSFICLAICEVVCGKDLIPPVYVVPENDRVSTRYFLLYPQGTTCNLDLAATDLHTLIQTQPQHANATVSNF